MRKLPPLTSLRAFEATARLGSVTRAAGELGRTHGAVSKQLQLLQDQLGVALFEKSGTGIRLNQDGAALFNDVSRSFDILEARYHKLTAKRNEASVHVACSATFAMAWLVPRLAEFYALHPDCRLQLTMSSSARDGVTGRTHEDADVTLSWDRLSKPAREPNAVALASVSFGLVAAPAYRLQANDNRLAFPTRISHDHMGDGWRNWQNATGCEITSEAELYFPHMHLCVSAAVAGLGVALVERRFVATELASGKLVECAPFLRIEDGFIAILHPSHGQTRATTGFLDWLRQAFAKEAPD